MALFTSHSNVTTGQREVALVVVEGCVLPIGWFMTGGAIGAIFAFMLIVLFMAGVAIGGCPFVNTILVTRFTICFGVFAFEFEDRQVVIELGRSPCFGGMTVGTIHAEASFMRLLLTVAGKTIL